MNIEIGFFLLLSFLLFMLTRKLFICCTIELIGAKVHSPPSEKEVNKRRKVNMKLTSKLVKTNRVTILFNVKVSLFVTTLTAAQQGNTVRLDMTDSDC